MNTQDKQPIIFFIGQFGCQLGSHIVKLVQSTRFCPFLTREGHFSCFFIDTEFKVIRNLDEACFKRYIKKVNQIAGSGKASGNWIKASESEELLQNVLSHLRDEVFKCEKEFCKSKFLINTTIVKFFEILNL